jgi:O-antigen/teichoic acid export membrane protein
MFIISTIGVGYVSVYKVFKQVINIFQKVTSSIQQSIMPQFSELSALNQKRRGFNIVNKIRNVILIVGIPLALVLGFSSKYWLNLLYGNLYSENWWILLIYLLVQVIALSYSAIHPYFLSLDKSKKCALYVLFANTIYVLYAYVFIHKLGLLTMVISFAIQSSIVILLKIHDINRELKMGGD